MIFVPPQPKCWNKLVDSEFHFRNIIWNRLVIRKTKSFWWIQHGINRSVSRISFLFFRAWTSIVLKIFRASIGLVKNYKKDFSQTTKRIYWHWDFLIWLWKLSVDWQSVCFHFTCFTCSTPNHEVWREVYVFFNDIFV